MKNFGSFLPSVEAVRLRAEVTKTVFAANQNMPECRRVTPGAADTVVERSLVASAGLPESLRHHLALVALSNYVALAQHDRSRSEFAIDTDLLPVAHPRSSRRHALTASALREARARWITSDPRIDEDHRPLVAAALTAEPGSVEHFYAVSRLEAAQDGIALRALLASFTGGNSSAARSARARLQRRDRKGRFAYQGGGLRALIRRRSGGGVESFSGRFIKEADNGDFFEMQAPDGRIYRVPASKAEAFKAYLPGSGDGYAGVPAKISSEDASAVIDESDLVELDAPSGYQEIGDNLWQTDGAQDYRVEKLPNGKFRVSRNDPEDTEVGIFDNWADAHRGLVKDGKRANKADAVKARLGGSKGRDAEYNDFKGGLEAEADDPDGNYRKAAKAALDYFEFGDTPEGESAAQLADRLEKNAAAAADDGDEDLADDLRYAAEEVRYRAARGAAADTADNAPEFEVPEGAFALKRADINDFTPRGRTNQDSPDYTDDPAELAQRFDADELRDGMAEALQGNGRGNLPFEQDEEVPAAALYQAMREKGMDPDLEVANIYDAAAGGDSNRQRVDSDSKATLPAEDPDDFKSALDELRRDPLPTPRQEDLNDVSDEEIQERIDGLSKELENDRSIGTGSQARTAAAIARLRREQKLRSLGLSGDNLRQARELADDVANSEETRSPFIPGPNPTREENDRAKAERNKRRDALDVFLEEQGITATDLDVVPVNAGKYDLREENHRRKGQKRSKRTQTPQTQRTAEEPSAELPETTPGEGLGPSDLADMSDEELDQALRDAADAEISVDKNDPEARSEAIRKTDLLQNEKDIRAADLTEEERAAARKANEDLYEVKKEMSETARQWAQERREWEDSGRPEGEKPSNEKMQALREKSERLSEQIKNPSSEQEEPSPEAELPEEAAPEPAAELPEADAPSPAQRATVAARDLQPGDVAITDKNGGREYFIVDEVREGGEKGKMVVIGHYPGRQQQEKQWKGGTKINVVRGADVPPPGDGPEIHKPDIKEYLEKDENGNVKKGQWVTDENGEFYVPNPEKQAEYRAALDPVLAEIFEASKGFDDPTRGETLPPEPPKPKPLKAPFTPGAAPLQGRLAEIAREANGDPQKMRELLANENVYVFDFETTGIEKDEYGAMITPGQPWSIAVSKIDPMTGEVIETRSIFMNPGAPLGDWAKANLQDADGKPLTDEWLATQKSKEEAFREALEFIGDNAILIGHNIDFDEPILRENADEYDLRYAPAGLGDTMSLSRYLQREDRYSKNKLGDLADKYGIENPKWHNAENDVAITAKIFDALLTDFQERGEPIDIDAISEWQRARNEEFYAKQKKFADDLAQRKADELVAEALHSEEKPDVDKAVSEIAQETRAASEAAPGGEDDEDLNDLLADILDESDDLPEMGERPDFTGEVVDFDFDRGAHLLLDNGDKISVIDDGFGRKESAYLKWNEATQTHKLLHADIRKWDKSMSDMEIARQHLDALYGAPEAPTADPDAESNVPEDVDLGDIDLPETDNLAGVKDAAGRAEAALDEALDGVEVNSEINELVGNVRSLRQDLDGAQNDREALDLGRDLADAIDDLGEALYDALPRENGLADRARDLRDGLRGLRRKNRKRARGQDVQRPAEPTVRPADAPENVEQEVPASAPVPKRATDNGGIPANEPTSVDGVGDFGVGVRTPAAPGERPSGITNGKDLPGAMPAGPDEPQGPDGRRLLRRGRENRRFWDHPLFEKWLNGGRAIFNRPWEGQFVDRNNVPLAAGDTVLYIGPGKNKGRVGVIVGREDNMDRNGRLHRDYVLVRFGKDKEVPLKSRNFILDPDEDTDWRFLVNPDEVPNDPAEERINLPAGFDWDQVRRGVAPQNTRGKGGELRGEGRDANNIPIAPGDALAQQERHELEGHLADDDGFILFEGDRVQIVKAVKGKPGPIFGEVVGKKYIPRYNEDGKRVGYGYYPLIRLEDGTIIPRAAKSLRILNISESEKAARRPDNPKASLPTLKKEGSKWVPDEADEGDPPVREVPPRKATLQNGAFTAAGDLAQVLDYQIAPNLKGQDFLQQAQELRERAEALRVLIDNGEEDQVVGEAVRDLADAAHVFGDRIRADRDNNAEINGKNPADALNGFGDNFEMLADGLTTSPKPRRGKWIPDGLEVRTDLDEDQVRVGDFVSLPNVGGAKVIEITNNDALQQRSFLVEDEAGRRTVLVTGYGAKFPVPVLRKRDKNAKPDPFIPRNVKRGDVPAKQIQVGDFVALANGYGLVISKEVSARNGAVRLKFRFQNGREWQANFWSGNKILNGALRAPAGDNAQRPGTPIQQMEVSPTPPPNSGAPVLDRNGRALSIGQRVVHNNKKKADELGEGVVEGFEKDPKYGKDVVKVRFADGVKRFRADRVFGQEDNNQNNNNNNNEARPAQRYAAALELLDQKISANKSTNIKSVLENGGDLSDLDPKTQALIKKAFPRVAKELNTKGDKQGLQDLAELVFELNKIHIEKHPAPESLGVGEELFDLDLDDIVEQFKNFPGKYDRYGNFQPGVKVPLVDKAGNPIPGWHAETLKMGAIGYTFFMVHESGQRFVLKKETKLETAAKEVVGAAMARGLGIPGATYAELYPKNKYISIQTFAGANEPLPAGGFGKMGRNMDANDFNDVPIDNIIRMILLDALSDNPDRHGGNYLYGEIVNDGEREVHVYPIDAGLGSFGTGRVTPLTVQTRFNGRQWGASRFDELGAFTTKEIAKMSLQELIQYLNRYAGPGVSDANIRNFAERMLERAKNAIADGISYGVFR